MHDSGSQSPSRSCPSSCAATWAVGLGKCCARRAPQKPPCALHSLTGAIHRHRPRRHPVRIATCLRLAVARLERAGRETSVQPGNRPGVTHRTAPAGGSRGPSFAGRPFHRARGVCPCDGGSHRGLAGDEPHVVPRAHRRWVPRLAVRATLRCAAGDRSDPEQRGATRSPAWHTLHLQRSDSMRGQVMESIT